METLLINFINKIVLAEDYTVYSYVEDTDPRSDDLHRCEPQTVASAGLLWGRTIINGDATNFDDLSENSVVVSAIAQCLAYPIKDVYAEYSNWGVFIRVTTTDSNIYEFNCHANIVW